MYLSEKDFNELFDAPTGTFEAIKSVLDVSSIRTELLEAHFLAQCAYESGRFRQLEENLNYSALRLVEVFPAKFSHQKAVDYQFQPEKIANYVYANKIGNGDEVSGDGWRYKGRGYIQVTGKNNYAALGLADLAIPGILWTKKQSARASEAWWIMNRLNDMATFSNLETVARITKRVNGSDATANERYRIFKKIWDKINHINDINIPKPF